MPWYVPLRRTLHGGEGPQARSPNTDNSVKVSASDTTNYSCQNHHAESRGGTLKDRAYDCPYTADLDRLQTSNLVGVEPTSSAPTAKPANRARTAPKDPATD